MKQSPQLSKAEDAMKPGVITKDGFLGSDHRHLVDILIEDDAEVARLGLTHEIIAEKMKFFKEKGLKGEGLSIDVDDNFEVNVESVRGKLACPFGEPGLISKNNVGVINKKTKKKIYFTDFHIHMIEKHGFYQGIGSPYRVSPKELKETLEIESIYQ
ncbi:MAG: hypothetical protein GQ534_05110 [Candidatus Delongbacteria bacterium]|nr:hypothetical protein [Candidatus Delongbacteria bacterium]